MEEQVMDTFATYKARYGAPRIAQELNALGVIVLLTMSPTS